MAGTHMTAGTRGSIPRVAMLPSTAQRVTHGEGAILLHVASDPAICLGRLCQFSLRAGHRKPAGTRSALLQTLQSIRGGFSHHFIRIVSQFSQRRDRAFCGRADRAECIRRFGAYCGFLVFQSIS